MEPTELSDDELLALARKARDCYGGGAPWERYFAVVKDPSAIIAMHERHRAEVERLTGEVIGWRAEEFSARDRAESAEAEVERLTRERDEAREMHRLICDLALHRAHEIEAAESALAAAQKREGELEKAGRAVFEYFFGSIVCRPSRDPDMEYELLSELRAALAGKEPSPPCPLTK